MDPFHTPAKLVELALAGLATDSGFSVGLNQPYSGAIVPLAFYGQDARVSSIMIELNRSLYMDEATGEKLEAFAKIRSQIQRVLRRIADFE